MVRVPEDAHVDPDTLAGLLTADEVENARQAAERFGGHDEERLQRARNAFDVEL